MTKSKRRNPDAEDILARPWCYYCERDFDDLKILISHQKAKHYKCDRCGRRLNTAGGLSVHLSQVHKETLTTVENALPTRKEPNVEIFGMEGIPEDVGQAHRQRVIQAYYEAQAERRAATGNPPPGGGPNAGGHKKPKVESVEELKKRLAVWKERKSNGDDLMTDGEAMTDSTTQNGHAAQTQHSFPPQNLPASGGFPQQPFGQPGYGQPPTMPPFPQGPPGFGPSQQLPPGMPQFPPFSPPGQMPFQPPQAFGAGLQPQMPFSQHPQAGSPAQVGGLQRPPSLPPASGLPQRPQFGAGPVPAFQTQQLHNGQPSQPPTSAPGVAPSSDPRRRSQDNAAGVRPEAQIPTVTSAAVDDLIASVAGGNNEPKGPTTEPAAPEKKARKEKDRDKAMQLVYSDNEVSPEEKMAGLPKYAFDPEKHKEDAPLGAVEAAQTGPVDM